MAENRHCEAPAELTRSFRPSKRTYIVFAMISVLPIAGSIVATTVAWLAGEDVYFDRLISLKGLMLFFGFPAAMYLALCGWLRAHEVQIKGDSLRSRGVSDWLQWRSIEHNDIRSAKFEVGASRGKGRSWPMFRLVIKSKTKGETPIIINTRIFHPAVIRQIENWIGPTLMKK